MKIIPFIVLCFLFVFSRATAAQKPNVIVIYTDDQGSIDTHLYGSKDLATPHMDALGAAGVRFTQMYAPRAGLFAVARAGLMTGRYPIRAGMPGNAGSTKGKAGMPAELVTMAETFKAAGYATAHIGKWHLGYTPETMPGGQGFDHTFGHMGGCIDNYSHFFYWQGPNRHDLWRNGKEVHESGRFFGDLMVEEAAKFVAANKENPFFIYFAINMPHYPYQGDAKWLRHYQKLEYPRNLYAAFLSTIDERIGQLLSNIQQQGLDEDTIVVFQSDHGHSEEDRAHRGGGNAGPYRGAKFSLHEGGIRVPSIIRWPGKLPADQVRDQVVHGCDWLPTLTALCGVPLLDNDIDGKDIRGVIQSHDAHSPHDLLHWTFADKWAVRQGDWKLIGKGKNEPVFLSNLAQDVSESASLHKEHPDIVEQLQQRHVDWTVSLRRK